jgi:dihydropteroate synthase
MTMLDCGGKPLDLSRPCVMGVLNVTPDSFSDGGRFYTLDAALEQGQRMAAEGADIIDVGGESTRPGAQPVSAEEELRRVLPVVSALGRRLSIPISVDTSKPQVMRAAVEAGAGMINDVRALCAPGALEAARDAAVPVCLMHMQGEPRSMQQQPRYEDVVAEVLAFLEGRKAACVAAGIAPSRLLLDPGFGFGKTLEHNLTLFRGLDKLCSLNLPLVVGISRKSIIGTLSARPTAERLYGSLAAALLAVQAGVGVLRVHDVAATVDLLRVARALAGEDGGLDTSGIGPVGRDS